MSTGPIRTPRRGPSAGRRRGRPAVLSAVAAAAMLALTAGDAFAQGQAPLFSPGIYLFLLVLTAIFTVPMGFKSFFTARAARRLAAASRSWPTAAGRVVESRTVRKFPFLAPPQYAPLVRYEYEVDGRQHTGEVVQFGLARLRLWVEADAEAISAAYPAGAAVGVRYDPAAPARAALDSTDAAARRLVTQGWYQLALTFAPVACVYAYALLAG